MACAGLHMLQDYPSSSHFQSDAGGRSSDHPGGARAVAPHPCSRVGSTVDSAREAGVWARSVVGQSHNSVTWDAEDTGILSADGVHSIASFASCIPATTGGGHAGAA